MTRVLAIDDDAAILQLLSRVLARDGIVVDTLQDPTQALSCDVARYDLIITDVMMPQMDGFELVTRLRDRVDAPIIFLTAKVSEDDAVQGLGVGGDDYLRKPFGTAELRAKVQAHLRREHREHTHALMVGHIRFALDSCEVFVTGKAGETVVPLTPTEYAICSYLARHPGQVFSRAQIREDVLGWESDVEDAVISVHVGNVRAKLRELGEDCIVTVWGIGYKWQVSS